MLLVAVVADVAAVDVDVDVDVDVVWNYRVSLGLGILLSCCFLCWLFMYVLGLLLGLTSTRESIVVC